MDIKTEKKIVNEYKNGKSSLEITKLFGISKYHVLKVLNKHNIVRKRDRCSTLEIKKDGEKYYVTRKCPSCNKDIKTISKDKVIACRNHFNKLKGSSLCKPCSLKLQVGEGNPFFGKKHSVKSLDKMSKNRKGKGCGDKNSMSNPMWRKKATENLKKKWNSGEMEHTRKFMSEKLKETLRLGKIKSTIVSKKEKEIVKLLKQLGYKPIHSYRVDSKICDVYIPSLNLIIEYFGDYWHCNPKKYEPDYFNKKKNKFAWELWDYDKKKIDLIKSYGYNLEVVWEGDLKHNNKLINIILEKYVTKFNSTPKRSRKD